MPWHRIGLALINVAVPVVWGLLVLWASNGIEALVLRHGRRKGLDDTQSTLPPLDYHI